MFFCWNCKYVSILYWDCSVEITVSLTSVKWDSITGPCWSQTVLLLLSFNLLCLVCHFEHLFKLIFYCKFVGILYTFKFFTSATQNFHWYTQVNKFLQRIYTFSQIICRVLLSWKYNFKTCVFGNLMWE